MTSRAWGSRSMIFFRQNYDLKNKVNDDREWGSKVVQNCVTSFTDDPLSLFSLLVSGFFIISPKEYITRKSTFLTPFTPREIRNLWMALNRGVRIATSRWDVWTSRSGSSSTAADGSGSDRRCRCRRRRSCRSCGSMPPSMCRPNLVALEIGEKHQSHL